MTRKILNTFLVQASPCNVLQVKCYFSLVDAFQLFIFELSSVITQLGNKRGKEYLIISLQMIMAFFDKKDNPSKGEGSIQPFPFDVFQGWFENECVSQYKCFTGQIHSCNIIYMWWRGKIQGTIRYKWSSRKVQGCDGLQCHHTLAVVCLDSFCCSCNVRFWRLNPCCKKGLPAVSRQHGLDLFLSRHR